MGTSPRMEGREASSICVRREWWEPEEAEARFVWSRRRFKVEAPRPREEGVGGLERCRRRGGFAIWARDQAADTAGSGWKPRSVAEASPVRLRPRLVFRFPYLCQAFR